MDFLTAVVMLCTIPGNSANVSNNYNYRNRCIKSIVSCVEQDKREYFSWNIKLRGCINKLETIE